MRCKNREVAAKAGEDEQRIGDPDGQIGQPVHEQGEGRRIGPRHQSCRSRTLGLRLHHGCRIIGIGNITPSCEGSGDMESIEIGQNFVLPDQFGRLEPDGRNPHQKYRHQNEGGENQAALPDPLQHRYSILAHSFVPLKIPSGMARMTAITSRQTGFT